MGWFNAWGLAIMALIMVPNVIFAAVCKDGFENLWHHCVVEFLEQVGRFSCFGLMIINIPHLTGGFFFPAGLTVYLAGNAVLTGGYLLVWCICFRRPGVARALALSILPSCIFLFSGVMLRSIPLILAALIFAPCHIAISYQNARLACR